MNFTAEQSDAIDLERLGQNACIVAGPGSGKTTVLVERYRRLVASGVEPSAILAITFTEKAAANMRSRLSKEFGDDPEMLRKLERAYVGTIHGFCNRLLKENSTAAGVDPEFEILDEQLAVLEQAKALRETLDRLFRKQPEAMQTLFAATRWADLESLLPSIYDAMRSAGLRPAGLLKFKKPDAPALEEILATAERYKLGFPACLSPPQETALKCAKEWVEKVRSSRSPLDLIPLLSDKTALNLRVTNAAKDEVKLMRAGAERLCASYLDEAFAGEKNVLIEILTRFDELYRQRKAALARLDFNDLEFYAVRLLATHPGIKQQVNDQFRLVMMDEFQDTSKQQSVLVNLIYAPGRFYAVGDLNQSIYSFRHASPAIFEAYRQKVEQSGAHHQELVENWRSREPILLATQFVLHEAPGITKRALIPARSFPDREEPAVELLVCEGSDEEEDYQLEAEWIASRILELHRTLRIGVEERPAKLSDFAVLVRNTNILGSFLAAFERAGIDYNLNRRSGFFETREARQLIHLLHMIYNPREEVSTLAVLRSDLAGLSDEALLRLKLHSRSFCDALLQSVDVPLAPEDRSRLDRFVAAFEGWRTAARSLPVDRLVLRALDEMGFAWNPSSAAGANIEKFLNIARSYASMTLGEFVTHLDAMRSTDPREPDSPVDETRDAVQVMSTHAAKGLEFPVVILAALSKGVDAARSPVLNFTPSGGLGVKWSTQEDAAPESGLVHLLNKQQIKQTEAEESNRLLYVAMTRAEEHLILSWTGKPQQEPENWAKIVSAAFLAGDAVHPAGEPVLRTFRTHEGKPFTARILRTSILPPGERFGSTSGDSGDLVIVEAPLPVRAWEPNTTATALARFASCPRKYYLGNYLGWPGDLVRPRVGTQTKDSPSRASDIGTQVHALLAGLTPERTDLESIQLAKVFERSPLGKRADKARRREAEWDFTFAIDGLIIRGTIDLWFEDAAGITLVDYKTDEVTADQAPLRAEDYQVQLQIYALALERALGNSPQQGWLHFLKPDVAVAVPLTRPASDVEATLRGYTAAQESGRFPLHVGAHCRRCEFFRGICPARLPSVTE